MDKKGFTLIEILIVLAISVMLSAVAIGYSGDARDQVALSVETAKVSEIILQTKELALSTYNTSPQTCGYGVAFDVSTNSYSVFAYDPDPGTYGPVPPCPSASQITSINSSTEMLEYSDGTWRIPVENGVKMEAGNNGDNLAVVLFYPPAPNTFISRDDQSFLIPAVTSNVYLVTADGKASSSISVNPAGQVNF